MLKPKLLKVCLEQRNKFPISPLKAGAKIKILFQKTTTSDLFLKSDIYPKRMFVIIVHATSCSSIAKKCQKQTIFHMKA